MKMEMYDDSNIGIALGNGFVETHAGNLHVYKDRTQAGNIVFITTENFKKYIPIEWLREYCKYNHTPDGMVWHEAVDLIIKRWEKENANK